MRPVNDFPAWSIDSVQRDADAAQHPDHASLAGRGTSLLYGRYDHLSTDTHDAAAYYRRNNATANTGTCVPVFYESTRPVVSAAVKDGATGSAVHSSTDAPVSHGTCASTWSSAEDDCVDEEGCSLCDDDDEAWCMIDAGEVVLLFYGSRRRESAIAIRGRRPGLRVDRWAFRT